MALEAPKSRLPMVRNRTAARRRIFVGMADPLAARAFGRGFLSQLLRGPPSQGGATPGLGVCPDDAAVALECHDRERCKPLTGARAILTPRRPRLPAPVRLIT